MILYQKKCSVKKAGLSREFRDRLDPVLRGENMFAECSDDAGEAHETIHAVFFGKKKFLKNRLGSKIKI